MILFLEPCMLLKFHTRSLEPRRNLLSHNWGIFYKEKDQNKINEMLQILRMKAFIFFWLWIISLSNSVKNIIFLSAMSEILLVVILWSDDKVLDVVTVCSNYVQFTSFVRKPCHESICKAILQRLCNLQNVACSCVLLL